MEEEQQETAYLLKPKVGLRERILNIFSFDSSINYDERLLLFVPERFVLGYFWDMADWSKFREVQFVGREMGLAINDPEELKEYQKIFDENGFTIIRSGSMPKEKIDELADKVNKYLRLQDEFISANVKLEVGSKYFASKLPKP